MRAHACSSGYIKGNQEEAALGRSRGGFSTKMHALVDALGNSLKFILTAGQRNYITQAGNLTQDVQNTTVIADKGYDSSAFVESLENKGCEIVITYKIKLNIYNQVMRIPHKIEGTNSTDAHSTKLCRFFHSNVTAKNIIYFYIFTLIYNYKLRRKNISLCKNNATFILCIVLDRDL